MITNLVSNNLIFTLIVVLGQGHFMTAFFYGYKGGRMDKKYLQRFAIFSVLLALVSYFVYKNNVYLNLFILVTFLVFVFHYITDELKLQGINFLQIKTYLPYIITLSFSTFFSKQLFGFSEELFVFIIATEFVLLSLFLMRNLKVLVEKFSTHFFSFLFFLINIVVPIYLTFVPSVPLFWVAGTVVIFHYIRWYVYYYKRFNEREDKAELYFYIKVVFWINILLSLLYIVHYLNFEDTPFKYLFSHSFFYGWTSLHILLSFKLSDFKLI